MNLEPHVGKLNPGQGEALLKFVFRGLMFLSKQPKNTLFEVSFFEVFEVFEASFVEV